MGACGGGSFCRHRRPPQHGTARERPWRDALDPIQRRVRARCFGKAAPLVGEQAVAVHWAGQASRFHMEVRIVVRGETRWVRFVFLCSRDASGKPVRWTGSTTDVTDRKCAEEALRISEERYARAMEGSDAGLWEWNPVTDAAFASPRAHRLFGIPDGVEIHSRDDLKAHAGFHSEDRQRIEDAMQACLARRTEGFEAE